ncbi:MAG TPA: DUF5681 domain-containing protein [Stellaceae bacterium]|nr:DUF5681 domain-containing protein [Stellaceae bacterium]
MDFAVDSLQTSAKAAKREPGKPRGRGFAKGQSGNPAGRQRGSQNRATLAAQLLLDGEAEALSRKAVELALGGDVAALRLCLDRIVGPRRDRAVAFALPAIDSATDLAAALAAVAAAVSEGTLTPAEAFDMARVADTFIRVIDARNEEAWQKRRAEAAAKAAAKPAPRQSMREWMDARFPNDGSGQR